MPFNARKRDSLGLVRLREILDTYDGLKITSSVSAVTVADVQRVAQSAGAQQPHGGVVSAEVGLTPLRHFAKLKPPFRISPRDHQNQPFLRLIPKCIFTVKKAIAYWQEQSYQVRLATLEQLRRETAMEV